MMELTLAVPVYLTRQLAQMREATDLSLDQLQHLAYHSLPALGLITEDHGAYHKFDLIELHKIDEKNGERTYVARKGLEDIPYLTGTDGIRWLCEQKGINISPVINISIRHDVYRECDRDQWYDISQLYADVEQRNNRVSRLAHLNAPPVIMLPESMLLWEKVELLESGHIGNYKRRWNHGRIIRALNDIGYSLADGWSSGMREQFERVDDEGRDAIDARRRLRYRKLVDKYTAKYESQGMTFIDALTKAHDDAKGNPAIRPSSVEGMGIQIRDPFPRQIIADFLKKHKTSFIRSDAEQKLYDRIQSGEDLDSVFEGSDYELDGPEYGFEHWAVAVANVMIRETGLSFGVHIANPDGKYNNRSSIMFAANAPWLYSEKDKKLSRNMLYQILDRYALELGLTVWESAYFIIDLEDE